MWSGFFFIAKKLCIVTISSTPKHKLMERNRNLEQIGYEDQIREYERMIYKALMLQRFMDEEYKIKRIKEKNKNSKKKRETEKSPLTTCIMKYVLQNAVSNNMVISVTDIYEICRQQNCSSSMSECVRCMKAAAAGAGHFLRDTHKVSFSPYESTITLQAAA